MSELYTIIYEDGTLFHGGMIEDSRWNSIDKPIKALAYKFGNQSIVLEGYEEYNHLIVKQNLILTQEQRIIAIILLGNFQNKIHVIELNLLNNKIITYEKVKGKEFNNSASSGWKAGVSNGNPTFRIN